LKHKDDTWFVLVARRVPWRYQGEIVWVAENSSVINEEGTVLPIQICPTSGILTCCVL
jgi:hypothetical protein